MATVIWSLSAQEEKRRLYLQGRLIFGVYVAQKIVLRIKDIQKKLECFPELGYREPLLKDQDLNYRACHINKRFKIIYWYDKIKDMVIIEDIWDVRRAPQSLTKRVENK